MAKAKKTIYKKTDIVNFRVYQLINRETNQRTQPAASTDADIFQMLNGLALFNPLDVTDEYKNSYVTQNWENLDLHLILEMINGKITVSNEHIIKLKEIGRMKREEKKTNEKTEKTKK